MNFSKLFKIIVVAVILVMIALLVHNLKPEPKIDLKSAGQLTAREESRPGEARIIPTADPKWNLYRNFKYGFQIQYPADWQFIKIYKTGDGTGDIFVGFSPSPEDSRIILNIYHNVSIDSYINKFEKSYLMKYEKVSINNKNMFKISKSDSDYDHRGYVFIKNTTTYALGGGGDASTVWYIDRMIETLEVF